MTHLVGQVFGERVLLHSFFVLVDTFHLRCQSRGRVFIRRRHIRSKTSSHLCFPRWLFPLYFMYRWHISVLFSLFCYLLIIPVGEKDIFFLLRCLLLLQTQSVWRDSLHTNLFLPGHVLFLLHFVLFLHELDVVAVFVERTAGSVRPFLAYVVVVGSCLHFLALVFCTSRWVSRLGDLDWQDVLYFHAVVVYVHLHALHLARSVHSWGVLSLGYRSLLENFESSLNILWIHFYFIYYFFLSINPSQIVQIPRIAFFLNFRLLRYFSLSILSWSLSLFKFKPRS